MRNISLGRSVFKQNNTMVTVENSSFILEHISIHLVV